MMEGISHIVGALEIYDLLQLMRWEYSHGWELQLVITGVMTLIAAIVAPALVYKIEADRDKKKENVLKKRAVSYLERIKNALDLHEENIKNILEGRAETSINKNNWTIGVWRNIRTNFAFATPIINSSSFILDESIWTPFEKLNDLLHSDVVLDNIIEKSGEIQEFDQILKSITDLINEINKSIVKSKN